LPEMPSSPVQVLSFPSASWHLDHELVCQMYVAQAFVLHVRVAAGFATCVVPSAALRLWHSLCVAEKVLPSERTHEIWRRCCGGFEPPLASHRWLHLYQRVVLNLYVGQAKLLQPRDRCFSPHAVPRCCALRVILRVCDWVPPPHDLLH